MKFWNDIGIGILVYFNTWKIDKVTLKVALFKD